MKTKQAARLVGEVVVRPLNSVRPNGYNPNAMSPEQEASLDHGLVHDGWLVSQALLIWRTDEKGAKKNLVIDGEHRWASARRVGLKTGPMVFLDGVTEADAKKLTIKLNQKRGAWDPTKLEDLLADLARGGEQLAGVDLGFDDSALTALIENAGRHAEPDFTPGTEAEQGQLDVARPPAGNEAPPIEEPPQLTASDELLAAWAARGLAAGTLWEAVSADGARTHRVLCGDCRKPEDVARLVGAQQVTLAFTSPPYASQRAYDPASGFTPIPADGYVDWFEAVQDNVKSVLAPDGSWFVNIKPASKDLDTELYVLDLVLAHARRWGWHFATELCWERAGMPGEARTRFKNQFEPIYQFVRGPWKFRPREVMHKTDAARIYSPDNHWAHGLTDETAGTTGEGWADGAQAGLAFPGNRVKAGGTDSNGHPATFPIALPAFFIRAYTDAGDVVFDPFLGSGTTLLAAEKTGRVGVGCELSPRYVAVVLERLTREGLTVIISPPCAQSAGRGFSEQGEPQRSSASEGAVHADRC